MPSANVRISPESREVLRLLAREAGEPMQAVLAKAIESYRREKFLREANAEFAAMRRNPKAWKDEQRERRLWDRALTDGIESDE